MDAIAVFVSLFFLHRSVALNSMQVTAAVCLTSVWTRCPDDVFQRLTWFFRVWCVGVVCGGREGEGREERLLIEL